MRKIRALRPCWRMFALAWTRCASLLLAVPYAVEIYRKCFPLEPNVASPIFLKYASRLFFENCCFYNDFCLSSVRWRYFWAISVHMFGVQQMVMVFASQSSGPRISNQILFSMAILNPLVRDDVTSSCCHSKTAIHAAELRNRRAFCILNHRWWFRMVIQNGLEVIHAAMLSSSRTNNTHSCMTEARTSQGAFRTSVGRVGNDFWSSGNLLWSSGLFYLELIFLHASHLGLKSSF